ncbi:MAG: hypothetical protein AAB779_03975, partial [Patescibacteria group bacterium]
MEMANIVLQYLEVFLGWPVVILILGLAFMQWFKKSISSFLERLIVGEAYGVRLEASSPSNQQKELKKEDMPLQDIEKYIRDNPKEVIRDYQRIFNSYRFERAFNIIYGTQMDLLEHLSTKGDNGDKYVNLILFYNEFIKRSNLTSTHMADYLEFLKNNQFIEYVDDIVKIT